MLQSVRIANSRMKIHCFDQRFVHSFRALHSIQLPLPRETHLWYVLPNEVKSEILLNQYMKILSPCEKEIVIRMRDEELKNRALLARALVRTTIARYQINSEISPRSLKFRKNIHGKPEIGIDVEEKHRVIKHNIMSFARRYFSKHEIQVLASIADPIVQQQEFIKLWTIKEAYVKAIGRGFSGAPFKTFTVRFRDATERNLINLSSEGSEIVVDSFDDPTLTSNWKFILMELIGSHYAAICTENVGDEQDPPMKLMVWKTIPFVEDKCVSGTDAVVTIVA